MKKVTRKSLALALLLVQGLFQDALASGFALIEQNASGLGNAYAGSAAAAEDASTIFFNAAGLTLIPAGRNIAVAAHAIDPSAKFNNRSTQSAAGVAPFAGAGNGGDAGSTVYLPNIYLSISATPDVVLGIGINAPFGLRTEYDDGWIGRFQGIRSELKTLNVNPTVAYRLNDRVSIGFGLNYQEIEAGMTKAINYSAVVAGSGVAGALPAILGVGNVEGRNELKGKDTGWGYNIGAMLRLSSATRLGIAYRSAIKYVLEGTHTADHPTTTSGLVNLIIAGNPSTVNQDVTLAIRMPDSLSLAGVHRVNDRWEMLGDISWTGWSKIQELRIRYRNGAADDVTQWKLRDTLRLGMGANYRYRDDLTLRFGFAFDQSPVPDAYRTVRLPDNDRTWLSVGARHELAKDAAIDIGFAYLFVKNAPIDNNGEFAATAFGYPRGLVDGSYAASVRILSAQYSQRF